MTDIKPLVPRQPVPPLSVPLRTLYFGNVQTMPFARPHFADVLNAIDFVVAKDYPARRSLDPGSRRAGSAPGGIDRADS